MMRRIPFQISGLLALNGVSILGNAITDIAIPWLILEISGSPLLVAAVMSAKIVPLILSIFFSAQLVDKYGAFRISVLSDLVNFLSVLLIPVFYTMDIMHFYLLAILLIFSTILDSPGRLAKDVMLAKEIKQNKSEHELINGINSTIENICDLTGPVLGSLIIALFGTINALYFDAVSFLVVALGLIILKKHFVTNINKVTEVPSLPHHYFLEALKYVKSEKELFSILILSSVVNFVIAPFLIVYLPYVNKVEFNSVVSLGVSMTCFGLGTTFSSLLYGIYGKHFANNHIILSGYSLLVLCLITLSLLSGQYILFAQLFAIGCCIGFTAPVEVTLIQRQVPENLFSRIITLFSSTRFLAVPVGYVCFGTLLGSSLAKQTPLIMATIVLGGLLAYLAMRGRAK
ncbi:MFS transporter [Xenorhabdus bovienii]|uniref:MFS transporter n=2 Tax=Xenorhabdus bovienii TaxID=40576 RepID=UPI0023B2342C|nr:MFS transporter [Xenorhabdus bovienii]MDE1485278.1 MFS transporter [Xenorhabdus bovienii]MDE9432304.1 MFS transporter [Xenorhabdus bovienii]MDE9475942.1 MFS transporter [Xenorhabdus bovienii]MDE9490265.1 MFS transporter [Xenorhabdus bovienii]MDE9506541.1 MFS transporter [Xenorhabdus bovienii]